MAFFFSAEFRLNILMGLLAFCSASVAGAAMDPRFELDLATLTGSGASSKAGQKADKRVHKPNPENTSSATARKGGIYTVRAGDHLFKILMRDYGLTNNEAESFIEEIKRENNIYDIKRLKIGQKLVIPPVRRRADGSLKFVQQAQSLSGRPYATEAPGQSFKLESPVPVISEQEVAGRLRDTWDKIVPFKPELRKPLALQTSTFSLTLDPDRYPAFGTMDGGRILLDQGGTIPALIKSLIQEKEPSLRIVTGSPAGTKRFMSSMLEAGGFYSVEENFRIDFGVDPMLSFNADFKVEKTPESLARQDIVLMNSSLEATPPALVQLLKKEGFSLYEPFASYKRYAVSAPRALYQITTGKQPEIVDSILKVFSIASDRDRRVDVFASDNNGISLAVKAERYFERGGERFVVTSFDGDPINYTLFRILETKGFRVVMLSAQDDFRKVAEKLLSHLKIKGTFARHNLSKDSSANHSLWMSGFKLDDAGLPGGSLFLTNLEIDRIVRDLLMEDGYSISGR